MGAARRRPPAPHAAGQIQVINHTFTHRDLRTLTTAGVRDELTRNDDWVIKTLGITTRPYYRPPFGRHTPRVDAIAAELGYTRTVLWDGSFSDSEVVTPQFLFAEAKNAGDAAAEGGRGFGAEARSARP